MLSTDGHVILWEVHEVIGNGATCALKLGGS